MSEKEKCMQNMYASEELKQTLTIAIFFLQFTYIHHKISQSKLCIVYIGIP